MIALNVALLALALQASTASQVSSTVSGVVLNDNGEPISNIRVTLGKLDVNLGPLSEIAGERDFTISGEELPILIASLTEDPRGPGGAGGQAMLLTALRSLPVEAIHEIHLSPKGSSLVYKSSAPVMTDAMGRFSFNSVDPGVYKLTFLGNGYAKQDYGQRTFDGRGASITLVPRQSKTDIVMRMAKVGAISGRIRDTSGQPAVGALVEVLSLAYDETGQQRSRRVAVTSTDDSGDYRIYALPPDRYYVVAGRDAGPRDPRVGTGFQDLSYVGGYVSPYRVPQFYTPSYYARATDVSAATPIDVKSGADVRGIDLLLTQQRPFRVRGRVVNTQTGQPPQRVGFVLSHQESGNEGANLVNGINPNYRAADGSFELQNVSAGSFFLIASVPGGPPQAAPVAFASLNVNADVDGVVLALGSGGSLNGRVRVESDNAASSRVPLDSIRLQLNSEARTPVPQQVRPQPAAVEVNGTFRIDNLRPDTYSISARLPEGFYLKEARFGENDVLNAPLRYEPGDTAALDLLISSKGGVIEGTAADAGGQPLPGALVVLIPNQNRERTELFRTATADAAGHFAIAAIVPGEYTLAAWESIASFAFFDPTLIRQADAGGKSIRVAESSRQTVNITTIR